MEVARLKRVDVEMAERLPDMSGITILHGAYCIPTRAFIASGFFTIVQNQTNCFMLALNQ